MGCASSSPASAASTPGEGKPPVAQTQSMQTVSFTKEMSRTRDLVRARSSHRGRQGGSNSNPNAMIAWNLIGILTLPTLLFDSTPKSHAQAAVSLKQPKTDFVQDNLRFMKATTAATAGVQDTSAVEVRTGEVK